MAHATNPILPGFNPDPSILRVGEDYYIATSTFEWFPGVQIHHSRDLIHWELIARPLNRQSQLDMTGEKASCGVWAPCLSYSDGLFYLIFTDVKSYDGYIWDAHNYLVTAKDICGDWSDPVYLNSSGFDPSLFHDRDGRKWLVNMYADPRLYHNKFGGIVMQEYSPQEKRLVGEAKIISKGSGMSCTEGPHLYWHDGYYYLMAAEGGTGYAHAVSLFRSKKLEGPYETSPNHPLITAAPWVDGTIQKAGHGSLVEAANGRWYVVHLGSRPVPSDRLCILGRETCIEEVVWEDGWLKLKNPDGKPQEILEIAGTETLDSTPVCRDMTETFDGDSWSIHFQSLRHGLGADASLTERKGWLRLYGRESLYSDFHQTLLARRQQSFFCQVTTKMEMNPGDIQHQAGLVYFYDNQSFYYCFVTRDESRGKVLNLLCSALRRYSMPLGDGISIPEDGPVWLRLETKKELAQFYWSLDGETYQELGPALMAGVLSDDYYNRDGQMRFTGAFIGICAQDISGQRRYADFDEFVYREL